MKAAVVRAFDEPPRYEEFPDPVAAQDDQLVVDVVAAALHPRVRSQANGSHYTSTGDLPLVPGIDAVVRDAKGKLYYALLDDTTLGTMAQRTIIAKDRSVALPKNADPVTVAAAINPGMSSRVALRRRIDFKRGSSVLILGATGSAGRMAIQVAKRFGAKESSAPAAIPGGSRNSRRSAPTVCSPSTNSTRPAMSTWSSTTCGANPPPKAWSTSSRTDVTAAKT
jgi:NADPH:quinone reductase-like Zn-dependent oxidoreductase